MRLLLAAPLLLAMPIAAIARPVTFRDALARAAHTAPLLRARALDLEARHSTASAAGRLPDPKLGISLDNFPVTGPPAGTFAGDSMTAQRIGISQDIPNLAKRHARIDRAEADAVAAEANGLSEARRVRVATALAWISLAYAERRFSAIDEVIASLRPLGIASQSGVVSGSARPAQTLDIQQVLATLEDRRSQAIADVGRARAALARWTGDGDVEVSGDMPQFTVDPVALRAELDHHPDLGVAGARTRQTEAEVTLARAEKRPDWGFDVAYQRRADRYGDMVSAGVTVSLPLFAKKRQDPMIAASLASVGAAMAEQEEMRRSLIADLESGLADHVLHHDQWMRARDTLLPLAQRRADLETASYSARRAGLLDVIQARSMLADLQLQTLDREAEVARDAARLVLTYGGDDR
ncbi:TolC family protein [Tardiphaga sp.]|uniref:TolC family protein n=1 Tax=Tardiphaga sp. TaxID=1926292 RepID=UPI00352BC0AD